MTTDIDTILAEFKTLSDLHKLALTDPRGNVWVRFRGELKRQARGA
jgi:hypothetical protein